MGLVPREYPLRDKDGNYIDYAKLHREQIVKRAKRAFFCFVGMVAFIVFMAIFVIVKHYQGE